MLPGSGLALLHASHALVVGIQERLTRAPAAVRRPVCRPGPAASQLDQGCRNCRACLAGDGHGRAGSASRGGSRGGSSRLGDHRADPRVRHGQLGRACRLGTRTRPRLVHSTLKNPSQAIIDELALIPDPGLRDASGGCATVSAASRKAWPSDERVTCGARRRRCRCCFLQPGTGRRAMVRASRMILSRRTWHTVMPGSSSWRSAIW